MTRILALVFVAILAAAPLTGCGKKGDPKPPEKSSTYPQQYPKAR